MKKFWMLICLSLLVFLPSRAYGRTFTDLPEDHWALDYVETLSREGVISGYPDGTFRPERYVSFLESLTIIKKIKNPSSEEISAALKAYGSLADKYQISDWAKEAFSYCLYKNIIYQSEVSQAKEKGYLSDDPEKTGAYPPREDLAVYFARALEVSPSFDHSKLMYKDLDKIGRALGNDLEVADYLAALVDAKIFDPKGSDGYFEPERPFRRAEMCKITDLSLKYLKNN